MRILIITLSVLVIIVGAVAVAMFTGILPFGPQPDTAAAQLVQPIQPVALTSSARAQDSQTPAVAAAPAVPSQPQPKVISRQPYGDWMHVCVEMPDDGSVRCSIFQRLADKTGKGTVFLWRISQDGKGGLVSSWQTPTNVMVNRGMVFDAGTEKPIAVPYRLCNNTGCEAVATLAPDFLETLNKTQKATATLVLVSGRGVSFNLSVNGLADALATLGQ